MASAIQVSTALASRETALRMAELLVERRLAGCVQVVGPVTSTYRWQGKIEQSEEWLCVVKSLSELYPQLEAAIRGAHSYETPEIVAVPIVAGSSDYLSWLAEQVAPAATVRPG
jgi:periplasmic divalent cation tolerance protein